MGRAFDGPAALCFVNQFVEPNAIALNKSIWAPSLFLRFRMHIRDRCRVCAGLVYSDKRTCEVSLSESESKALYGTSISEKAWPKSNQSRFANRPANDRRRPESSRESY